MFDLALIATLCQTLETSIADTGEICGSERASLVEAWQCIAEEVSHFVGDAPSGIQVSSDDIDRLLNQLQSGASHEELELAISRFSQEPLSTPLTRLGKQAERLVEQLGKQADVRIDAHGEVGVGSSLDVYVQPQESREILGS